MKNRERERERERERVVLVNYFVQRNSLKLELVHPLAYQKNNNKKETKKEKVDF